MADSMLCVEDIDFGMVLRLCDRHEKGAVFDLDLGGGGG